MLLGAALLTALPPAEAAVPYPEAPNDGWDVNGDVFAIEVVDTTVYVGGTFTEARSPNGAPAVARRNLAAFDMLTGDVLSFAPDPDGIVRAVESDGTTVWIGGNFDTIGGVDRSNLAAVDVSSGTVLAGFDVSNNGPVYGLRRGNGRLYAAGYFTIMGGTPQQRVASLDPATGAPDPAFQAMASGTAQDVAVSGDGRLFVGGGFTSIGGRDDAYLAELDPATGAAVGPGFSDVDAQLLDVDVTPDGSRVFAAVAGFQNRAAAWNAFDGTRLWYHRAMGDTQAVGYHDGTLYFGFHEGFGGDTSVRMLAAEVFTGSLEDFRPSMNSFFGVWAIDASAAGLAAGGEFTVVSGVPTRGVAVFPGTVAPDTTPPTTPTDLSMSNPAGSSVSLQWTESSDGRGVSYYRVFRDGAPIGATLSPGYVDDGVAEDTEYSYRVQASDLAGNLSPPSDSLTVKTWTNLVEAGDAWRYSDDPQAGSDWRQPEFADGAWPSGAAELGFGDGDEATVLAPGSWSYYFRKDVTIPLNQSVAAVQLRLIRDDGAVVYVNGVEVFRSNMPDGPIAPTTPASSTIAGSNETSWVEASVDAGAFQSGMNTIAVELHQRGAGSSDVSFDMQLDAALTTNVFDEESPSKPKGLKAVGKKPTRIRVRWNESTDNVGVAGYKVFRDGVEVGFTTDLFFKDDGLWPETEHAYKVHAVDAAGNLSPRSRIRSATTPPDDKPPSRPKNATLSATPHDITVLWEPAIDNVAVSHYLVKSSGVVLATTTDTSHVYSGLEPETEYHIALRAVDVFGNKGKRKHLRITTPSVVVGYEPVGLDHVWSYRDDGSNQGTVWSQPGFEDSSWDSGIGEFGYGDGDETTEIDNGPDNDHFITTYFRTGFGVVDATGVSVLELRLRRDDGAVVYINGVEVYRTNLPGGAVDFETLAVTGITGAAEDEWLVVPLNAAALVSGENVLAVEVHQVHRTSSDLSFHATLAINP